MIRPLFNQVLVRPAEKKTGPLADQNASFLMYGEVLDIGPDCTRVKVGETVFYTLWGLNHIEIDGTRHYFVPEHPDFLLAVLEEESVPGIVAA